MAAAIVVTSPEEMKEAEYYYFQIVAELQNAGANVKVSFLTSRF
jgi:hypothetical protein